jgi:hypothetical protein
MTEKAVNAHCTGEKRDDDIRTGTITTPGAKPGD